MTGWIVNGVRGRGETPPALADNFKGSTLLIAGSGRDLWADVAAAPPCTHVLCVNFAGSFFPGPFHHWASCHPWHLPHWLAIRAADLPQGHIWTHTGAAAGTFHGEDHLNKAELVWDLEFGPGCSGQFAAAIGVAMGYDRIVLAGVPEDGRGHFYDPPGSPGTYSNHGAREHWTWLRDRMFAGKVKSMSGLTRDLLGAP